MHSNNAITNKQFKEMKSLVMKKAWEIFKSGNVETFSQALRVAWVKIKYNVESVFIIYNELFPVKTRGQKMFLKSFVRQIGETVSFDSDVLMSVLTCENSSSDHYVLFEYYRNQFDLIYN